MLLVKRSLFSHVTQVILIALYPFWIILSEKMQDQIHVGTYGRNSGVYAWLVLALIMFLCFEFRRLSLVEGKEGVTELYIVGPFSRWGHLTTNDQLLFYLNLSILLRFKKTIPLLARPAPPRPVLSCSSTSSRERPRHFRALKYLPLPRFLVFSPVNLYCV